MNNPYIVDRPLTDQDLFFGRETCFDLLAREISRGARVLMLYGRHRFGKTSFLQQLPLRLNTRYQVRRVDLEVWADKPGDPLWLVMLGLGRALQQTAPEKAAYEAAQNAYAREYVNALVVPEQDTYLVCFDALPITTLSGDPRWAQALAILTGVLAERHGVAFLLACEGHPDELPPNANLAELPRIVLGPLKEDEAEDLLMVPVQSVLAYNVESVRQIYRLTGGHPYLEQLFGRVLFEQRAAAGWVSIPEVERAIEQVVTRGAQEFDAIWQSCSPKAQIVAGAFAEMMGYHGMGAAQDAAAYLVRIGVQIPAQDMSAAFDEVVQHGILERLGGQTFRFSSELMRHWIRRHKTTLETARRARRNARQVHVHPVTPVRQKRMDWVGMSLWVVAGLLALFVALTWRSRQRGIAWTIEPTSAPTPQAVGLSAPTMTPIPPTPETGVAQGHVVYMVRDQPEDKWQIYAMRSDGSDPVRLTHDDSNDTAPVWSPDGRRIAFVSDRTGSRDILVMNADGNEQLNLTQNAVDDWTPCWSPDGKRIAFASFRDRNWEIYVMDASGANLKRLTDNGAIDFNPAWSPDGQNMAFVSNRDGNLEIYVMDADGNNPKRFTNNAATDESPVWSPDGKQLFWQSYRDGNMEIYTANVDSTGLKNLTHDSTADDHGPTCSPWGRHVAFFSNHDRGWDIYTLDLETGERTNLTMSPAWEQSPNWGR